MTSASLTLPILSASAGAAFGLVFGLAYFAALRRTTHLFSAGGGYLVPAALTLGRLAGAVVFFGLAARLGALPVLASFFGFLLARTVAVRTARWTA
jgi:uncharacterized membrane protein